MTQDPVASTMVGLGNTVVTITADDGHTTPRTCTVTVSVEDHTNPSITCPGTVTASADNGQCSASGVDLGTPSASDNCDTSLSISNNAPSAFPVGDTTVTWTATDDAGNQGTCTQTVTVTDDQNPTITCPATVNVNADTGLCEATNVSLGSPTHGDNCPGATVANDHPSSTYPVGQTIVTWTVTDASNHQATCQQTINVADDQPPVITQCPSDVTVNADNHGEAVLADYRPDATVTDNCPANVTKTQSPPPGTTLTTGGSPYTVTITASDGTNQNQTPCQFQVTVASAGPTAVKNAEINACYASESAAEAAAIANSSASGGCGGPYTPHASTSGTCTATVSVYFTDNCNNPSNTLTFATRIDGSAPVVTCPADKTVNADAGGSTAVVSTGTAIASDICYGSTSVSFVREDGATSLSDPFSATFAGQDGTGVTRITWSSTDSCGNTGTCIQRITVNNQNEVSLSSVQLGGVSQASLQRCIRFELYNCPNPSPVAIVNQVLAFSNGTATTPTLFIPAGTYTCAVVSDKLHTLRRTAMLSVSGSSYVLDLSGKPLIGGNLNDDAYCDILDFGKYVSQYNVVYGSPQTGDTTCSTPAPHADFSGDGKAYTEDFTFIQVNFLKASDPKCCSEGAVQALASGNSGPIKSISVADLKAKGMADLAVADLDKNGVLDQNDVAKWLSGTRPTTGTRR